MKINLIPSVNIYGIPGRPDVEIWDVRNMLCGTTFFHDTYTVCSLVRIRNRGWAKWGYRGEELDSPGGSLMMMEPGEVHATKKTSGEADYFVLRMAPRLITSLAQESGMRGVPHLKTAAIQDDALLTGFMSFHRSVNANASRLEVDSLLARCGFLLLQRCGERVLPANSPGKSRRAMEMLRDYIHVHASEDITLEQLAALSGLSRFYLLREFRRTFGLPPHSYQIRARITRAMRCISTGVQAVHAELGFTDQSHFIRHFKSVVGVTPGEYAGMIRPPSVSFAR